jgi:hypothetical protein
VKSRKADAVVRVHKMPEVVFEDAEDQKLTSFGGLVIYRSLFDRLDLKTKLRRCFTHKKVASIYGLHRIVLIMVLNAILGYRKLRDTDYYCDDSMLLRVLGLNGGSVLTTMKHAEGTGVGFNKRKMSARSYYPLFRTIVNRASSSTCITVPGACMTRTGPRSSLRHVSTGRGRCCPER